MGEETPREGAASDNVATNVRAQKTRRSSRGDAEATPRDGVRDGHDVDDRSVKRRRRESESADGSAGGDARDGGDGDGDEGKTLVRIGAHAGRVIGRGGETVKYIESRCAVRLEFRRDEGVAVVTPAASVDGRTLSAQERRENARKAKALVEEVATTGQIMERLTAEVPVGVNVTAGITLDVSVIPADLMTGDEDEEVEVNIPVEGREGRVIGRGAATIREISARSGANCHVVRGSGVCVAKGKRKNVRVAYQMIFDTLQLTVDRFAVQPAAAAPQAVITHPPTSSFGQSHMVAIQGLPQGAVVLPNGMAMVPLSALGVPPMAVPMAQQFAHPSATGLDATIEVPCSGKEGRIVGRGGEMIKHLRAVTGCMVDIKNNKTPSAVVVISGLPANVDLCRSYVCDVMENGDTRSSGGLGVSARTQPHVQYSAYQHAPPHAPQHAPLQPQFWHRYYDASGKAYEHNPSTNETRWV